VGQAKLWLPRAPEAAFWPARWQDPVGPVGLHDAKALAPPRTLLLCNVAQASADGRAPLGGVPEFDQSGVAPAARLDSGFRRLVVADHCGVLPSGSSRNDDVGAGRARGVEGPARPGIASTNSASQIFIWAGSVRARILFRGCIDAFFESHLLPKGVVHFLTCSAASAACFS